MMNTIYVISNDEKTLKNFEYFTRYFKFHYFYSSDIKQLNLLSLNDDTDIIICDNPQIEDLTLIRTLSNVITICIFKNYNQRTIIDAYEKGIDDHYICPISYVELFYKIKVFIKHKNTQLKETICYKEITVSYKLKKAYIKEVELNLTYREFMILYVLLNNLDIYFTKETLLKVIWNTDRNSRTVDTHVCTLKKKLGVYSNIIINKKNYGYCIKKD